MSKPKRTANANWRIVPGDTSVEDLSRLVREEQEKRDAAMEQAKGIARKFGETLAYVKLRRAIDGLAEEEPSDGE